METSVYLNSICHVMTGFTAEPTNRCSTEWTLSVHTHFLSHRFLAPLFFFSFSLSPFTLALSSCTSHVLPLDVLQFSVCFSLSLSPFFLPFFLFCCLCYFFICHSLPLLNSFLFISLLTSFHPVFPLEYFHPSIKHFILPSGYTSFISYISSHLYNGTLVPSFFFFFKIITCLVSLLMRYYSSFRYHTTPLA